MAERVRRATEAGCDMMLHCNGNLMEMQAVAQAAGELKGKARTRARNALKQLKRPTTFDKRLAAKELDQLLLVVA
jgi:beta-N-acetylhexosaminidase